MMRPGGMQLTVIPCLPTSRERPLAQACIAALAEKAPLMPSGSDLPVRLMMRPHLRAIICSSSLCASWRWRVKLSVIASSHCASVVSSLKAREPPALLTRMSTEPRPFKASAAIWSGAPSLMKSHAMTTRLAPISFCSSSRRFFLRAATASFTPSAASALAMPRPMPALAPVTSAVLPAMPRSTSACFLAGLLLAERGRPPGERHRAGRAQHEDHAHGGLAPVVVARHEHGLGEAERAVEAPRGLVRGAQLEVHARHAGGARRLEQPVDERAADAAPAVRRVHGEEHEVRALIAEIHD